MLVSRTLARPCGKPRVVRAAAPGVIAMLVVTAVAGPLHAQGVGRGFLFEQPAGSLVIRGGFTRATAESDIFSETTSRLTLGRGDFNGFSMTAELGIVARPRLDFVIGTGYSSSGGDSEFREYVDLDDLPIEQTTTFRRIPLMLGAKLFVMPRGRQVGSLAWIPARYVPYVGAGFGMTHWSFEQKGAFVDYETLAVFDATLSSSGFAETGYGSAGLDVSLSPRLALTGEARYWVGKGDMNGDFVNFDKIDLSGLAFTMGLYVRF